MKKYVLQPLAFLLMVTVILGGGWLGIRSMGYVLPSGTDGVELYTIDTLTEENFQAPLSSEPLPPFTATGFPEQAVSVAESKNYNEYLDLLATAVNHSTISPAMLQILDGALIYYEVLEENTQGNIVLDIRTYTDEQGVWVLYQSTVTAQSVTYQLRVALHSVDGIRLVQLLPVGESSMLSPDRALLQRAADACSDFLASIGQEYMAMEEKGMDKDYTTYQMGDGTTFPMRLTLAASTDTPLKTVIAGTQCLVYYPGEKGGQVIVVYDFVGMHISGIAYVPEGEG
jgi:hypothetical protein